MEDRRPECESRDRAHAAHLDRHHLPRPTDRVRPYLGRVVDVAEGVMNVDSVLAALEATRLAASIRESLYFFPFLESLHVVGLTMVFGTIAVLDLRMLGIASIRRPVVRVALDVEKWAWMAFALTAATGALMFTTNAGVYYHNIFFRLKMAMLVLAGLNVATFELTARRSLQRWNTDARAPFAG